VFDNPLHGFTPIAEVLTSNFPEHLGIKPEQNLTEARRLASEVSLPPTLSVPIHFGTRPLTAEERAVLESLRQDFAKLGLQISFVPTTTLTFEPGDSSTPFKLDRRGSAFHDPLIHLNAFSKGGLLSALYADDLDEYAGLVEQVSRSLSPALRQEGIRRLNRLFYERSLVIPLYEDRKIYWINPSKVVSVGNQDNLGLDISAMTIQGL